MSRLTCYVGSEPTCNPNQQRPPRPKVNSGLLLL